MSWTYADRDVMARVETLRRGDRIYLPGPMLTGGRVVAGVETYPTWGLEQRPCVVVSYYTGARARPMDHEPGEPGELVQQQLGPMAPGERVRCRRCVRVTA